MAWASKIIFCLILFNIDAKRMSNKSSFKVEMMSNCIRDMALALPTQELTLIFDYNQDEKTVDAMIQSIFTSGLKLAFYRLGKGSDGTYLKKFVEDVKRQAERYSSAEYFILANESVAEDIVQMISSENLARRNIVFLFFWKKKIISRMFKSYLQEAMRICVITNPRYGFYHLLYNQADPSGENQLDLVNWWTQKDGLFHLPLLPKALQIYKNFKGRTLNIPVLHKPPWNFVNYNNDSIEVSGGRDDKLLKIISSKLNFNYEYFDPPDRSQGSAIINGTMQGVLGLIWQREVELFIGDLSVTYERSLAVEFSFPTLADSEAFLTHAPGLLNEALALVRPFQWDVWPPVLITILVSGPLLYLLVCASAGWKKPKENLLSNCIWITTSIFLRQSISDSFKINRVRLLIVLLYLAATYVIGDMYSANLTSMLARPAREKPISTLYQLEKAMEFKGYQLLVERHSASHATLENGTGLYKSIWEKMKGQPEYLLDSSEEGMKIVKNNKNFALIGGRETFFYDTRRFGVQNFHLSEKLFTRYSAIALQIGSPFIDNFNEILMRLFQAGVLTKITEDEYQKLKETKTENKPEEEVNVGEGKKNQQDEMSLKAISMKTLQGAFYLLIAGYILAGLSLIGENISYYFKQKAPIGLT